MYNCTDNNQKKYFSADGLGSRVTFVRGYIRWKKKKSKFPDDERIV